MAEIDLERERVRRELHTNQAALITETDAMELQLKNSLTRTTRLMGGMEQSIVAGEAYYTTHDIDVSRALISAQLDKLQAVINAGRALVAG